MMEKTPNCATCKWRHYTEAKPGSLPARLWKWHTGWCPGWKAYQKYLREGGPAKNDPQENG